jgi:hypothetical protein
MIRWPQGHRFYAMPAMMTQGNSTSVLAALNDAVYDREWAGHAALSGWPGDQSATPERFQSLDRLCTKSPVRNLTQQSIRTFWPRFGSFLRSKSFGLGAKSIVKEHFLCKAAWTVNNGVMPLELERG